MIRRASGAALDVLASILTAKPVVRRGAHAGRLVVSAQPLAQAEPDTSAWFAIKIDDTTFGIFDVFPGAQGRQAHLDGPSPRR